MMETQTVMMDMTRLAVLLVSYFRGLIRVDGSETKIFCTIQQLLGQLLEQLLVELLSSLLFQLCVL